MGWTPKRYVLAEDAVPNVVERKADHRVQAATGHQQPADRGVPVAGDAYSGRTWLVERQHHRNHARQENAEQPDDDEVVRRVRQRTRVATVSDVPADIPNETEQSADDRRCENQDGQRDPGRPVELVPQPLGDRVEPGDPVRAMGPSDVQQHHADDHRGERQAYHLVEACAARRRLRCQKCQLHRETSHRDGPPTVLGRSTYFTVGSLRVLRSNFGRFAVGVFQSRRSSVEAC